VCRTDGICGDFSTTESETLTVPSKPALYFTTNEDPTLNLAYFDMYDSDVMREYTFLDAGEVTTVRLHGRDAQVVFRPSERRGTQFSRQLLLYNCPVHFRPSFEAFTPIINLAEAPITHVIVRDTHGNRWTAALTVPDGAERIRTPSHIVYGSVEVTEVSV
jgi:hypothetical protein